MVVIYEPLPYKRDAWILTNRFFRRTRDEFGNWADSGEKWELLNDEDGRGRVKGHVHGKIVDGNGNTVWEQKYCFSSGDEFDAIREYVDADRWLDENHPEWRDTSAYWD